MKKLLFIYNPTAGRKKYYPVEKIIKNYFKEQADNQYQVTWHNLALDSPFAKFDPDEFEIIFAVGGDGTVKEVATWILNNKSQTPLAIIPSGSANLLSYTIGVPGYIRKALIYNLTTPAQKIDVGLINNRHYFLIAAGCGFDAKVIKNTSRKLKKIFGFFAYLYGALKSFFNIKADKVFVKIDDQSRTYLPQSIFISNFKKFFNVNLNPESAINDGYLNVSIFKPITLKGIGLMIWEILNGNYKKKSRYEYFKAKQIYILPLRSKIPTQIDGEIIELPYMDIEILPMALNIISTKLPH